MRTTDRIISGLYAVTPDEPDTQHLATMVGEAIAGGAHLVQYRNKTASAQLRAEQAMALLDVCRAGGVALIINDDIDLAARIGADGLHLGRDDGDLAQARARLPSALLGASCYGDIGRAQVAKRLGADYVAFGSFFASSTKPGATRAPLAIVAEAKRTVGLPVVAIGGITLANAPTLLAAGVDAVAVISALFAAGSVRDAAQSFTALFTRIGRE
ncbi:MAG: thiamine phosphate synthase [Betaproteobacteria bacterium]|nr:MAG: thiamine phosphate synthase [Betaproteobacteria bacterium]